MDDDQESIEPNVSIEELENRLLALKKELGSEDDTSDESDNEELDGSSEYTYDNSSIDTPSSSGDEYIEKGYENNVELECPVIKKMKVDESSTCDELSRGGDNEGSSNIQQNNKDKGANSLKRKKRIPEYRSADLVLPLPSGWIEAIHDSGLPIYMHRLTRVVTLSRPYEIRSDSFRRHSIPIGSIPCEQQRRMTDHREKSGVKLSGTSEEITVPQVQLKTMDQLREERISPDELYEKAKDTFCIKEVMVYKYKDWKTIRRDRKKELMENAMKEESTIDLDVENPMITVAAGCGTQGKKIMKKGYVINVVGKTTVTLLHEYVQKVLKGGIEYQIEQVKSSINPYSALCYLKMNKDTSVNKESNDEDKKDETSHLILIGRGSGDSKKSSKAHSATEALKNLVPGLNVDEKHIVRGNALKKESVEAFDMLSIDDERVIEYSKRTGRQLPYAVLLECLRMNAAWGASKPEETSTRIGHHKYELTMKVGRHETTVTCSSLKDGKQRAAQCLLKKLYPVMDTWGSIFRLSSSGNGEHLETKRVREQVVRLAPNANGREYGRNEAVLSALRSEMNRASIICTGRVERKIGLKGSQPVIDSHEVETKSGDTLPLSIPSHSIDL